MPEYYDTYIIKAIRPPRTLITAEPDISLVLERAALRYLAKHRIEGYRYEDITDMLVESGPGVSEYQVTVSYWKKEAEQV
jgi:hypothetical protein